MAPATLVLAEGVVLRDGVGAVFCLSRTCDLYDSSRLLSVPWFHCRINTLRMGQAGLTVIVDAAGIGGRKANRTLHLLSHHVQILPKFPRVGGGNGFENSSHDASWGKKAMLPIQASSYALH